MQRFAESPAHSFTLPVRTRSGLLAAHQVGQANRVKIFRSV
jgi:hypothetical protein